MSYADCKERVTYSILESARHAFRQTYGGIPPLAMVSPVTLSYIEHMFQTAQRFQPVWVGGVRGIQFGPTIIVAGEGVTDGDIDFFGWPEGCRPASPICCPTCNRSTT